MIDSPYRGTNVYLFKDTELYCTTPPAAPPYSLMASLPIVGIPCYVNGAATGTMEAFVGVFYDPNMGANTLGDMDDVFQLASAAEIGSTWGAAFQPKSNSFYAGAVIKRHVGLTSGGTGMIFKIPAEIDVGGNPVGTVEPLIDLNNQTFGLTGQVLTGPNPHGPLGAATAPSNDATAFAAVGTVGLGDLELTEDGNTLYAMNLFGNGANTFPELVEIDVTDESSPEVLTTYPVSPVSTLVNCTNGVLRPWAIELDPATGDVYIGCVCSAESATPPSPPYYEVQGNTFPAGITRLTGPAAALDTEQAKLRGYVFRLDKNTGTYTSVLDFPLDANRSNTTLGFFGDWLPWTTNYPGDITTPVTLTVPSNGAQVTFPNYDGYPQPIVGDLEILNNGELLVSMMDRWGLQTGTNQYKTTGSTVEEIGRPAGEILRFGPDGSGGWSSTVLSDYGDIMSQFENEVALGGIAISGDEQSEFIGVSVDPTDARSNGLSVIAINPPASRDVQLLIQDNSAQPGVGEKGLGLGDVEIGILDVPAACGIAISSPSQSDCQGGASADASDDFFTVTLTATATTGTSYEVAIGAGVDGTGGTVLGAASFGAPVTLGDGNNGATGTFQADGMTVYSLTIRDPNDATCFETITTTVVESCPGNEEEPPLPPSDPCAGNPGDIGGVAFLDIENDGAKSGNQGQGGIIVSVYDCAGMEVNASPVATNANGEWTITGLDQLDTFRVEFTMPEDGSLDFLQPSFAGADNGSRVQFVVPGDGDCTVDYGVVDPGQFCQTTPDLITPCFVNGNTSTSLDALVRYPYGSSGLGQGGITNLANNDQIGSTAGIAYARTTRQLYLAAFLKRHVGLVEGLPGNPLGRIFVKDLNGANATSTGGVSQFINLEDYGANVGTIGTNADRGLGGLNAPSADDEAYTKIAEVGLGDIDISTDERFLYVVSINDQQLFIIEIDADNNPATAPAASDVIAVPIPDPGCQNGEWRPFALKVHQGAVYVGGVCDASALPAYTDQDSRLRAYVYRYDGASFTTVYDFPLTYYKGRSFRENADRGSRWVNWTDVRPTSPAVGGNSQIVSDATMPQPVLSDLEFDVDGAMILGFMDRYGHQIGQRNYPYNNTSNFVSGVISGDILRAALQPDGSYLTESAGISGGITGFVDSPQNYNEGPGGGEFFDDNFINGARGHGETSYGHLAFQHGLRHLLLNAMDPVDVPGGNDQPYFRAGGTLWLNGANGQTIRGFHLFRDGNANATGIGKASGLGDLELLCDPVPLQLGNYVWLDEDRDGVQDPCEPPLADVPVTLFEKDGETLTQVDSPTMTDENGEYYFDNVDPNTVYLIAFGGTPNMDGTITVGGEIYTVTGMDQATGENADAIDSDAELITIDGTQYLAICYTTGTETNHDQDVGLFSAACSITINSAIPSVCAPGDNSYELTVNISYENAPADEDIVITYGTSMMTFMPDGSGEENFVITGIASDGAEGVDVSAAFETTTACSDSLVDAYDAPPACENCPEGNCGSTTATKNSDLD